MMSFEHPLGRLGYCEIDHEQPDPPVPIPTMGHLDSNLHGTLGSDNFLDTKQAAYLTYVAIGAVLGVAVGSWVAGGTVVDGRSNDIWGGMAGAGVGTIAFIATHGLKRD